MRARQPVVERRGSCASERKKRFAVVSMQCPFATRVRDTVGGCRSASSPAQQMMRVGHGHTSGCCGSGGPRARGNPGRRRRTPRVPRRWAGLRCRPRTFGLGGWSAEWESAVGRVVWLTSPDVVCHAGKEVRAAVFLVRRGFRRETQRQAQERDDDCRAVCPPSLVVSSPTPVLDQLLDS